MPGAARGVGGLGGGEIALLDGRDERRELGRELGGLLADIRLVRVPVAVEGRGVDDGARRAGLGRARHREGGPRRPRRVADQLVAPAVEVGGQVDDETRDDVLDLVDDGRAREDLELAELGAGVGDLEDDPPGGRRHSSASSRSR